MYVHRSLSMENRLNSRSFGCSAGNARSPTDGVNRCNSGSLLLANSLSVAVGGGFLRSNVGPTHAILGIGEPANSLPGVNSTPTPKRQRKERAPNWTAQEMTTLVTAKRAMFIQEATLTDARELMIPDANKWLRISTELVKSCYSPVHRDGPACKSKWNQLIPEYKRIADFLSRSGTNEVSYWSLSKSAKKAEGLPLQFPEDVFYCLHEWYVTKPTIRPPHSRDLLSADDSNYGTPVSASQNADHEESSYNSDDHVFGGGASYEMSDDCTHSTQSPMMQVGSSKFRVLADVPLSPPCSSPPAGPSSFIPPSITPYVLSSSDTSDSIMRKKAGSTGVRRKSVSGHSIIAEATRATGEAMTCQMKEMADSSRELEKSKIDVQLHLFGEQMDYQRERDQRLHENACLTNDNAKLSIVKQGELVACLAQLSTVLTTGLLRRKEVQQPQSCHSPPPPPGNADTTDGAVRSSADHDESILKSP